MHVLVELLISTALHACHLEVIPGFVLIKHGLGVALTHMEVLVVDSCTVRTDERTEHDIGVCRLVLLTVDAEGIKLIRLHSLLEVSSDILSLDITCNDILWNHWVTGAHISVRIATGCLRLIWLDHFHFFSFISSIYLYYILV